jgi:transcriptional regulator with XRE-family HTH domain
MATMEAVVFIGNKLKDVRVRRAMSQDDLAEKAGVGKNTVNRLERNHTEPRPSTLRKLARALEVDPAELVGK